MEVVDVVYREHLFEIAQSVMHTAGQSANMAYAGSGVNALDRAGVAAHVAGQARVPGRVQVACAHPVADGKVRVAGHQRIGEQ